MKKQVFLKIAVPATAIFLIVLGTGCRDTGGELATVVTGPVSDKTINSATCGGEVTAEGDSPVTARGVCWSPVANPTTADSKTVDGEGLGLFSSQLTGLSPDDVYHVRAYAVNEGGTAYGQEVTFTTSVADSGQAVFTDKRDGRGYRTQIIGTQTWMAENLAYLPMVAAGDTGSLEAPYYYVYRYDSTIVADAREFWYLDDKTGDSIYSYREYGVLYNWTAARSACPAGWHLPTDEEWKELSESVGPPVGGRLKETGLLRWKSPNTGATNSTGFSAVPAGQRYSLGGYRYLGEFTVYWSATERNEETIWTWHLYYNRDTFTRDYFSKANGFSVRCVRD